MSNDLERGLRAALRAVDPPLDFSQRVLARIERSQVPHRHAFPTWLPVALAASAIFGAVVTHAWHVRHQRQGLEARQQVIDALRVTGEKLDLAYRVVNAKPRPAADPTSNDSAPDDQGA